MRIESFSIAPGASVTVPLIGVTGQTGQVRSPYPTPDAVFDPADGSVFTVELVGTAIKITGVAEGSGTITLVTGRNRVVYPVTVEAENASQRWSFAFASLETTYVPPPEPLGWEVLVNDQRVQLTFTGDPADEPKDIDWGDGTVWDARDDNPAQYDYQMNGVFTVSVNDGELVQNVAIDHYPVVDVIATADPIVEVLHNKGDQTNTKVEWGDGNELEAISDTFAHQYAADGTYTITTTIGGFPPDVQQVTIQNASVGGATVPPTDTVCYGPFDIPGLQQFWVCTSASNPDWFSIAIDVDEEPGPDLQVFGAQLASALDDFPQEQVAVAIAKVREVWGR